MNNQNIITVLVAIIFTIVGFGAKTIFSNNNSYQAGWEAAKKRMVDSQMCPVADEKMEIKSINGEIKSLSGSNLTLKAKPIEPISNQALDERMVDLSKAKIYQLTKKDPAEYQKEIDAFVKKVGADGNQEKLTAPEFYAKQEIKISDLKAGQQIIVKSDQDLKTAKNIQASEVQVQFVSIAK